MSVPAGELNSRPGVALLGAALVALLGGCHLIFPFDVGAADAAQPRPDGSSDAVTDAAPSPNEATVEIGPPGPDLSQPPMGLTHDWSRRLGGTDADEVSAVAVDSQGNVHVTGFFMGKLQIGTAQLLAAVSLTDLFLARFSPKGAHLWTSLGPDTGRAVGHSLVIEPPSDVLVLGAFSKQVTFGSTKLTTADNVSDIFLARFKPAGAAEAVAFQGVNYDYPHRLLRDSSGDLYLTGAYRDKLQIDVATLTSTNNSYDAFVAGVDASGKHRWTKTIGGAGADYGYSAALDPSGGALYVTGSLSAAKDTAVDLGGGVQIHHGGNDAYLVSYTTKGAFRWSKLLGGPGDDRGRAVAVDSSGDVYVTGSASNGANLGGGVQPNKGQIDVFVTSFDKAGKYRWSRTLGSAAREQGLALVVGQGGALFVAGQFEGDLIIGAAQLSGKGQGDICLASLSTQSGAPLWASGYGGVGDDYVTDIALAPDGGLFVVGWFHDSIDFGGGQLAAPDAFSDGFVLKLKPK